jgi:integrase
MTQVISADILAAQATINVEGNRIKALVAYYFAISILTGARRGELQQLCWRDIELLDKNLVKITIRGETSKVRRTRQWVVHDTAQYFKRLKQLHPTHALLFSPNDKAPLTPRAISYHFDKLMSAAEIVNVAERDLVQYSFRHYFITKKVNANLPIATIAEMCGTSISQIEKTYYHLTHDAMVLNALAGAQC